MIPGVRWGFLAGWRPIALNLVLIVQGIGFYAFSQKEEAPPVAPLVQLPGRLGGWQAAEDVELDPETARILHPDDYLLRVYRTQAGDQSASLFVAYFRSQRTGHAPHTPQNCLPGHGWTPEVREQFAMAIPGGASVEVNRLLVAKNEERSIVLYWYQTPTRVVADEYRARLQLLLDSMRHGRSDTALVRIVVQVLGNEQAATQAAISLASHAHVAIRRHIPVI